MKLLKLLIIMIIFSLAAGLAAVTAGADAIHVQNDEGNFRSVLINTREAGLLAGHQYALVVEIDAVSTTGFRVRYTDAYSGYFGDGNVPEVINSTAATARNRVATQIPASFEAGSLIANQRGEITVFFTHGIDLPDVDYNPDLYYIGVYGILGGWGYEAVGVQLSDVTGNVLIEYGTLIGAEPPAADEFPEATVTPPPPPPEPEPAPEPDVVNDDPVAEQQNEPTENEDDSAAQQQSGTTAPSPVAAPPSSDPGGVSGLTVFFIVIVAVIFGGAAGGAILLKKG
jgi:hypothetical protein